MSAHRAELALKINRVGHETALFDAEDSTKRAMTAHLVGGSTINTEFDNDATRVNSLRHAAAIAEFSELLMRDDDTWFDEVAIRAHLPTNSPTDCRWMTAQGLTPTPAGLYGHALDVLGHYAAPDVTDTTHVRFLELRASTYWLYLRALRIEKDPDSQAALDTLDVDRFLAGTGIGFHRLHLETERLAALCRFSEDKSHLMAGLSQGKTEAAMNSASRSWWLGRLQLVHAMARYQAGQLSGVELLGALSDKADQGTPHNVTDRLRTRERSSPDYYVHQLSTTLCAMDVAHRLAVEVRHDIVYQLAQSAIAYIEKLFQGWRVLARSQSPLAAALRACLGDVADVCAARPGAINELGFRVSTLIKQNTLTHVLQDSSLSLPKHIQQHLAMITQIDNDLWATDISPRAQHELRQDRDTARQQLERLIQDRLHLMSLEYLDPDKVDTAQIISSLDGRQALDYAWIESTNNPRLASWYRTHVTPLGEVNFAKQPAGFRAWLIDEVATGHDVTVDDLQALSVMLIPQELKGDGNTEVVDPLIISPHNSLDIVPWPALLGVAGPLIDSFVISLTPCLANLSTAKPADVVEPALVHLVAQEITVGNQFTGQRLNLGAEFASWQQPYDPTVDTVLSLDTGTGAPLPDGGLKAALRNGRSYGFLHVAAHGSGEGLRHTIYLPEPFTAAEAFGCEWPAAVLLAVCHSGELRNQVFTEPLALCVAVLAGGASAVVAGMGEVSDEGAGFIASHIATRVRDKASAPLPELLRDAQLAARSFGLSKWQWSRFITYVA